MTAPKRSLLTNCLVAAGLLTGAGMAQAADADVSSIFGRGSPPNAHITHADKVRTGDAQRQSEYGSETVRSSASADAGKHADRSVHRTTPSATTTASDAVTVPTGSYLAIDEATRPQPYEAAVIRNEELDGTPLVDGRGMREGVDYHSGPAVTTDPSFEVADILGRASPPAPANAPGLGMQS